MVRCRLDHVDVPNVPEFNPVPGCIPDPAMNSCFPKAARAAGLGYDELIQEVVRIAWRRLTGRAVPVGAVAGAQHAAPRHAAAASAGSAPSPMPPAPRPGPPRATAA